MSTDWEQVDQKILKSVKGICFDIDDTITFEGKLHADAYSALWELKNAGFCLVPITGRSAGWCDLIARFWPVDAVVGENGAFVFYMENGVRKRINTLGPSDKDVLKKINDLSLKIKEKFPKAQWASDQSYREYDLAIDIVEDVKGWHKNEVDELCDFLKEEGAKVKVSSIHVNTWFGDYDKAAGFKYWLADGAPGISSQTVPILDEWIFIGDSPNDEPLFKAFKLSVAVANIKKYLDLLEAQPTWIVNEVGGRGFSRFVDKMCKIHQV